MGRGFKYLSLTFGRVVFLDALPKNLVGKVMKKELRGEKESEV